MSGSSLSTQRAGEEGEGAREIGGGGEHDGTRGRGWREGRIAGQR